MKRRFIVRFRGSAPAAEILARVSASPAIEIIEQTPRMVLVEGPEDELRKLVGDSRNVVIVPEQYYERPDAPLNSKKE